MKIQIPTGWKIILYLMLLIGLFQTFEVWFRFMNKPDSFIANIGAFLFGSTLAMCVYSIIKMITLSKKLLVELEEKEDKK